MEKLKKLLELVKKTGDKCFITDFNTEEMFVLMSMPAYEKLLGEKSTDNFATSSQLEDVDSLTEEGLLDKINKDVADWKAANDDEAEENNK